MDIAWRNGAYLPRTELVVGIDAAALRYAAVIFDGLRCHIHRPNARCARLLGLPRHLARFARSCEALSLPLIFNASELREAVRGVIRRCRPERSCGVRLFAFSESERFDGTEAATVCAFLLSLEGYAPPRPLRLVLARERRPAEVELPRWVKATAHYAGARRAVLQARAAGADDVVFLNERGNVTESSRASLLFVRGGVLVAPPVSEGVLPGITREIVRELATRALGLAWEERPIAANEIPAFAGALLCSSSLGVASVGSVDAHTFADQQTPASLARELQRLASAEGPLAPEWVDELELEPVGVP